MTTVCQQDFLRLKRHIIFLLSLMLGHADCLVNYMQVNYFVIGVIVLLGLAVIIFLILRNRKDEKDFEKDQLEDNDITSPQDPSKD